MLGAAQRSREAGMRLAQHASVHFFICVHRRALRGGTSGGGDVRESRLSEIAACGNHLGDGCRCGRIHASGRKGPDG